jgi:N-alpha-acetyltransferase 15/16, NatA auxiliary subunit
MTLSAYTDLLRFEDKLYSHENYFNAAKTIVQSYVAIHARPVYKEPTVEELYAHLSGSELRKALRKHKRIQQKKEEEDKQRKELEAKERQRQQQSQKKKGSGPLDEDPEGKLLESVAEPLNEASKFASQLSKWCSDRLDTHFLAFDVYSRKKKWLLALRAVRRAIALAPTDPSVHLITIRLAQISRKRFFKH